MDCDSSRDVGNISQSRKAETCDCPCGCGGKAVYHLDAVTEMPGQFMLALGDYFCIEKDEREFRRFLSHKLQVAGDDIMALWRKRNAGR